MFKSNVLILSVVFLIVAGNCFGEIVFAPAEGHPESIIMDAGKGKLILKKRKWSWINLKTAKGKGISLTDPFLYEIKLAGEKTVYWMAPTGWKNFDKFWSDTKFEKIARDIHQKETADVLHIETTYKGVKKDVWLTSYPDKEMIFVYSRLSSEVPVSIDYERELFMFYNRHPLDKVLLDEKTELERTQEIKKLAAFYQKKVDTSVAFVFGPKATRKIVGVPATLFLQPNKKGNEIYVELYTFHVSSKFTLQKNKPLWKKYIIMFGDGDLLKEAAKLQKNFKSYLDKFYVPAKN